MRPAPASTTRHRAFDRLTVALQVGHGGVALATIIAGTLLVIQLSTHIKFGLWNGWLGRGLLMTAAGHLLIMFTTPLWNGLGVRTQKGSARLWAWLGYLVPVASYWLPARNLRRLIDGTSPESHRLRTLVLVWGLARSLATPEIMAAIVYGLYRLDHHDDVTAFIALAYMLISVIAANLLSLVVLGRMHRYLLTTAIDESHARVFE